MKVKEFRRYYAEQPPEFWLGLVTLVGVITLDVLPGLVIGAVSMLLLVVYHASRPHLGVLGAVPGAPGAYGDITRHPDYQQIPGLLILRLEAPLFYANASLVRDHVKHSSAATTPTAGSRPGLRARTPTRHHERGNLDRARRRCAPPGSTSRSPT